MQRYQVVVNGNTYTVTVKSLLGSTAIVDVDGWEFQVAISDGDLQPEFVTHSTTATAPSAPPATSKAFPTPAAAPVSYTHLTLPTN